MDDAFEKVGKGCVGFLAFICSCAVFGAVVTLTVYLAMYGFSNPDNDCWYGVYASEEGGWPTDGLFQATEEQLMDQRVWDIDHVHQHFVTWFIWGFSNYVLTLCATCIGGCMLACGSDMEQMAPGVLGVGVGCAQISAFAWYIAGLVWRFRQSGSYASGDDMPSGYDDETWNEKINASDSLF